jgi:large subunit ribosomal protein L24
MSKQATKAKTTKKPRLRKNDTIVVIAGRDRGRQGRIVRVLPAEGRVIVERVNMIKRHTRPNPQKNIAGGISEKEASIHISNVMLVDPDRNVGTRIGRRRDADGKPERIAKKSGAVLA